MKAYSLPKKIIIKKNAEFKKLFRIGNRTSTAHFLAVFVKADDLQVGFASSREYKTKPERNRIKRITRELWRLNFRDFQLQVHVVIIAKASILKVDFRDLVTEFRFLLGAIKSHCLNDFNG